MYHYLFTIDRRDGTAQALQLVLRRHRQRPPLHCGGGRRVQVLRAPPHLPLRRGGGGATGQGALPPRLAGTQFNGGVNFGHSTLDHDHSQDI